MSIPEEDKAIFERIEKLAYARGYVKGVREAVRRILLRIGTAKFGERGPSVAAALDTISDVYRLEDLAAGVLAADSWDDLLRSK